MERLRQYITKLSSPHYYHGTSAISLVAHNAIQKLGFFRRRGPSRKLLAPTKKMKNSKKGKTALVLGSGPSLNSLNPIEVRKYFDDVFVVNNYYLTEISKELAPDYYCLSDPNYFVEDKTNAIHNDHDLIKYMQDNNTVLLLSHFYRKSPGYNSLKTLFFDDREWRTRRKNISPLKPRGYSSITLYKAIAIACFFGYDTIYVLGLDNTEFKSYVGSKDNKIYINNNTHYAFSQKSLAITSTPEGYSSGIAGRMQSYALHFGDLTYFKNFRVINLDPLSLVDAFEKIESHPVIYPK